MQVSKAPPSSTAIVNAPMPSSSRRFARLPVRLALYGGGAIAVVAAAALVKYFLSQLAEQFVYSIPFLGGLLQSLELAELGNLLVFAILGLGVGALTRLLPVQWGQRLSAALLIVLVPFIFLISTQVRYGHWVQTVADQEQLSRSEAITLTNAYLDDRIQSQGWWGFYRYTARYTALPISQAEMQRATGIDARVQAQFAKVTGLGTTIVTGIMTLCSWGLRLFYFVIAAIVTVSHFQDGLRSFVKRSGIIPSTFPSVPPSPSSAGVSSPRPTPPRQPQLATRTAAQPPTRRPARSATKATAPSPVAQSAVKPPAQSPAKPAAQPPAKPPAQSVMPSPVSAFPKATTPPPTQSPGTAPPKPQPGQPPQSQPATKDTPAKPPSSQPAHPSRPPQASPPANAQP